MPQLDWVGAGPYCGATSPLGVPIPRPMIRAPLDQPPPLTQMVSHPVMTRPLGGCGGAGTPLVPDGPPAGAAGAAGAAGEAEAANAAAGAANALAVPRTPTAAIFAPAVAGATVMSPTVRGGSRCRPVFFRCC